MGDFKSERNCVLDERQVSKCRWKRAGVVSRRAKIEICNED